MRNFKIKGFFKKNIPMSGSVSWKLFILGVMGEEGGVVELFKIFFSLINSCFYNTVIPASL